MHFKKFGKYTILTKLASGGMADILLASDLSPTGFGRFVVIKRALSKFSDNEEFKDMFKNEGKVACNLKHRNIVPVYEFGIEKNQFYLTMEYISGRNLRELLKRLQTYKNHVDIPNAVHIIKEVASGLNYAHNAVDSNTGQPLNLIHRDVSPQNIMLSFDGEIKLIDFGIAKIADTNLTRAGHLKGKFSYMSPEQAHGEVLDERTDIFCLGIILWELLTNKRLFASKNEMLSLKKIKNCDIPDAQKINPQIPTSLNNILKKALAKNKNVRYKTAAKLEQDLSVFLNKNYHEYSHYDFISLMKKSYRKEIMDEREKLKNYADDFKKYINNLNIEDSFIGMNKPLNMNNISNFEADVEKGKQTQTLREENSIPKKSELSLSSTEEFFNQHTNSQITNPSVNQESRIATGESSTLIQNRDNQTETTDQDDKSINPHNVIKDPLPKTNKDSSILTQDFSLIRKNQTDFLKNSKHTKTPSLNSRTSLYSKDELYEDLGVSEDQNFRYEKRGSFIALFPILAIIGFGWIFYLVMNDYDIINSIKSRSLQKNPQSKVQAPVEENTQATAPEEEEKELFSEITTSADRKIFINSKPSGAKIYINNEFSSKYTPSLVSLSSNENTNIILKKDGFTDENFTFDPKLQKNSSLNMELKAKRHLSSKDKIQIIRE